MKTRRTLSFVLMGILGGLVVSGCTVGSEATAGMIAHPQELSPGSIVRDFPVTTGEGKATTFSKLRKPISIVAFVSPQGDQCCWINPEVVTLADRYRNRPVTIAQISEPTAKCSHGAGCTAICDLKDPHLVALCDVDRIAWRAYHQPQPNSVVVVGTQGEVVAVEALKDLKNAIAKAEQSIRAQEAWEAEALQGG